MCTTSDGDEAWCATETDASNNMVSWSYCKDSCPGVTTGHPTVVNPLNEPGKCYCGVKNGLTTQRIVGGVPADNSEYPWQVALLFGSENTGAQGCGGTLVGERHVITAAHCTAGQSPPMINVLIGDTTIGVAADSNRVVKPVAEIINHPDYNNPVQLSNDISVLVLAEPVKLDEFPDIKPACLPEISTIADFIGQQATVSGWGTVGSGLYLNSHLHEVDITVYGKNNCGAHQSAMSDDMFCAGLMSGGKDSCQGDSGGPVVIADPNNNNGSSLIGVVSWGYGCAAKDAPGVYSDVSNYMQNGWLATALSGLSTCPPPPSDDTPTTVAPTNPPVATTTVPPTTTCPVEENARPVLQAFKKVKKVKDVKACRALCEENQPKCQYFAFLKHKKAAKRTCQLYTVAKKTAKNWFMSSMDC